MLYFINKIVFVVDSQTENGNRIMKAVENRTYLLFEKKKKLWKILTSQNHFQEFLIICKTHTN